MLQNLDSEWKDKADSELQEVFDTIDNINVPYEVLAEYFGFFIDNIVFRFLNAPNVCVNSFSSSSFNASVRHIIEEKTSRLVFMMDATNTDLMMPQFYYIVDKMFFYVLRKCDQNVCMELLLRGVLDTNISRINTQPIPYPGDLKHRVIQQRKYFVLKGVLSSYIGCL